MQMVHLTQDIPIYLKQGGLDLETLQYNPNDLFENIEDEKETETGNEEVDLDINKLESKIREHLNALYLYIRNNSDDKDIYFQTDDGSGNTTTYFHCDGSSAGSGFTVTLWPDNNQIGLGTGKDLRIYHQSSDNTSRIQNLTNDLIIVTFSNIKKFGS